MNMIHMTFHSKNINIAASTFSLSELFEFVFHTGNIKNFTPVSGAKNNMIVNQ